MQRSILTAITAALAFAAMAAAPAAAAETERFEARIAYADLDLTSQSGADALLNRIRAEARQACDVSTGRMSLRQYRMQRECVRNFQARAVSEIGDAYVTQRFAERGGRAQAVIVAAR